MRVEYQAQNRYYSRTGLNLSGSGMFVQTECTPKLGDPIRVVFSLPGVPLLFDLNGDPAEQHNLFDDPQQRDRIRELTARIRLWRLEPEKTGRSS